MLFRSQAADALKGTVEFLEDPQELRRSKERYPEAKMKPADHQERYLWLFDADTRWFVKKYDLESHFLASREEPQSEGDPARRDHPRLRGGDR